MNGADLAAYMAGRIGIYILVCAGIGAVIGFLLGVWLVQ